MLKNMCAAAAVTMLFAASTLLGQTYQYFRVGNTSDATATTTAGTVLMGGGNDVDDAFAWMCERSGGGDFVVIRATGTDAYNPYIQRLCRNSGHSANSVATLIVPSAGAANLAEVSGILDQAEAIFIAGGDQSNYINFWTGTGLQAALDRAIQRGVPIGGTSAGLNVLTEYVYSALGATGVTSSEALADPYSDLITLTKNFVSGGSLQYLQGIIGDPHFVQRDRMGRDLAFLCHLSQDFNVKRPRAVGVDTATALLIDEHGTAKLVGNGTAYFLEAPGKPETCASGTPLTYTFIDVQRVGKGDTFDLATWSSTATLFSYTVSANAGVLSSSQKNRKIY